MLDQMKLLHEEMRGLTIRSGIKEPDYNIIATEVTETTPLEVQQKVSEFLEQVYNEGYKPAKEIWNLLPEEVWERYKTFNITGLREQLLLEEKLTIIRKSWRKFLLWWKALKPK